MSPIKEIEGKTLFEKLMSLGYGLPRELALLPSVILNPVSTDCILQTSNNLLEPITFCQFFSWSRRKMLP